MTIDTHRFKLGVLLLITVLAVGCSSDNAPITVPTNAPTKTPTAAPTTVPTVIPTIAPTSVPTIKPTITPTAVPTTSAITIIYTSNQTGEVQLPNPSGLGHGTSDCPASYYSQTFVATESGVDSFSAVSLNPSQVTVSQVTGREFTATEPMSNTNNALARILVTDGQGNAAYAYVGFVLCAS